MLVNDILMLTATKSGFSIPALGRVLSDPASDAAREQEERLRMNLNVERRLHDQFTAATAAEGETSHNRTSRVRLSANYCLVTSMVLSSASRSTSLL